MIGAVAFTAATIATMPLLFVWRTGILAELSRRAGQVLPGEFTWVLFGILALIAVTASLGFLFLRELRQIVDTVAQGDPFIPENAGRLRRMGWLAVAVQLVAIPAGILAGWASYVGHAHYMDIGFSFGGVFLALILFVLARIFRKGAEMRDELEGTV